MPLSASLLAEGWQPHVPAAVSPHPSASAAFATPHVCTDQICRTCSEAMYLKFREIRHRKTVKSTARRVLRYSMGKMVVIIAIAIAQPAIIAIFFKRQFKI